MIKCKHDGGGGGFSHAGVEYRVGDEGFVEVADAHVDVAVSHGYRPLTNDEVKALEASRVKKDTAPTPIDVASMKRLDLAEYLAEHRILVPEGARVNDLRSLVQRHADGEDVELVPEPEEEPDGGEAKEEGDTDEKSEEGGEQES